MQAGGPRSGTARLAGSRSTSKLTHYRTGLDLLFSWPPLPLTTGATAGSGSRIARGDLAEEITALKSEPGGGIIMAHGGAAFVQALSRSGLIDEYRLVILPVALGNGLPLFKDLPRPLRVDLAEARSFPDGTVIHVYQPITTTNI